MAQSFVTLSALVAKIYPDTATRPKIIGPDADYQDSNATQHVRYKEWAVRLTGAYLAYVCPTDVI